MSGVKFLELQPASDLMFARSRLSQASSADSPNVKSPTLSPTTPPTEREAVASIWKEPRRFLARLRRRSDSQASDDKTSGAAGNSTS